MSVAHKTKLFQNVAKKRHLHVEPSIVKKKELKLRGKSMGVGVNLNTCLGEVEVRYGIHLPVVKGEKTEWRLRPSCIENVERHVMSGNGDLVFEGGWFRGELKEALEVFDALCVVFDPL